MLDNDSLEEKLREHKEELFNLRFQAATGQLESHGGSPGQARHRPDLHDPARARAGHHPVSDETDDEADDEGDA